MTRRGFLAGGVDRPVRRIGVGATLLAGIALAIYLSRFDGAASSAALPAAVRRVVPTPSPCDLSCAARRVIPAASVACSRAIEQLAAFGARWSGSVALTQRFAGERWTDATESTLTLAGSAVEFKTGAESYLAVDYECDVDIGNGGVAAVRARPRQSPGH